MLTGAARAAKRMGGTRLERVWVVALPVVVLLVLERLYLFTFLAVHLGVTGFTWPSGLGVLVGRGAPWSVRTTLVVTGFAAAGYVLMWAILAVRDYVHSVRRAGKRVLLTGAGGRLLVMGLLFLTVAYELSLLTSMPDRKEVLAQTRIDVQAGRWYRLLDLLEHDVPGVRTLCRETLEDPSRSTRLLSAAALQRMGSGDRQTTALLRSVTRDEFEGRPFREVYILFLEGAPSRLFDGVDADEWERWQEYCEGLPE
jgi:hypothetical protein